MENNSYKVKWEIDIEAQSPEEASWLALQIQRDRNSEAVAFDVETQSTGEETFVDLLGEEDPRIKKIKSIINEHGSFSTFDVEADSSPFVNGAGFVISLAETFYIDNVTVCNYNNGIEESEYNTTYEELPDSTIDSIVELAESWVEINVEDNV